MPGERLSGTTASPVAPFGNAYTRTKRGVFVNIAYPGSSTTSAWGINERGDIVGEIGPFLGHRTANATTVGDTRLLRITLADLEELRRRYPKIGATVYRNLTRVLADRVGNTMEQLR